MTRGKRRGGKGGEEAEEERGEPVVESGFVSGDPSAQLRNFLGTV